MNGEKPDLPTEEEALLHYGVLGMKWGKSRTKATSDSIKSARARVVKAKGKIEKQETVVNALKGQGKAYKKQEQDLGKMKASLLKNPDRILSTRMTRGEKYTAVIFGTLTTGPIGLTAATAAIAVTSAKSRAREQKLNPDKKAS